MTRPSRNTDRLLLEAGKKLIPEMGISGLTVRAVAKKAGVNLGMFNYHFKTKDTFVERLLSDMYEDFFKSFKMESETGGDCRERLKNAVLTLGRFVRARRRIIIMIIQEIIIGNRKIMEFAKANMTRHIMILLGLIKECQKKKYIAKMPLPSAASFFIAAIVGPNIVLAIVEQYARKGLATHLFAAAVEKMVLTDKELQRRVEIAFKGLAS